MSQTERILHHLREIGSITPKEAMELYGIMRLGARIWDLRHSGHDIRREMVTECNRYGDNTRFARYWLYEGQSDEVS